MNLNEILKSQKEYLQTHPKANPYELKIQLISLKTSLLKHEQELYTAFYQDFHKPKLEVYLTEFKQVINELNWFINNLWKIHKKKHYYDSLWFLKHQTYSVRSQYGVCLIFSPYNYPFNLSLIPLIAAIALNNTVILKLASFNENVNKVIQKVLAETFLVNQCYVVDNSEADLYQKLYELEVDMVFFTGSEKIGQQVYMNYSQKLIPVVLELGGKCPVIIDGTYNLELTAKRVIWSKMVNNGQTCIGTDYLIVKKGIKDALVNELVKQFNLLYPKENNGKDIAYSVNKRSLSNFKEMLIDQKILASLKTNENQSDLVLVDISLDKLDSKLMNTEIFGPLLPIVTYENQSEILKIIARNDYPLATYVYTNDKSFFHWVFYNVKTGAVTQNDNLIHFDKSCSFGGIKNSGVGQYHKWASVGAFSYLKPMVIGSDWDVSARYAPYNEKKFNFLRKFYK